MSSSLSESFLPVNSQERGDVDISYFKLRFQEERHLLFRQWKSFGLCLIFLLYFVLFVFRNMAYYYADAQSVPLKDWGHELVEEIPEHITNDIPMYIQIIFVLCLSLGSFFPPPAHGSLTPVKPYLVNTWRRLAIVYCVGMFLRALTYVPTAMPSPAKHCHVHRMKQKPSSFWACFYHLRFVSMNGNCGDLNFSGHVFFILLCGLFTFEYAAPLWATRPGGRFHFGCMACTLLLAFVQMYIIVATRHHYTVDVILAIYVTPLLWHFSGHALENNLEPHKLEVRVAADVVAQESIWKSNLFLIGGSFVCIVLLATAYLTEHLIF